MGGLTWRGGRGCVCSRIFLLIYDTKLIVHVIYMLIYDSYIQFEKIEKFNNNE